MDEATIHDLLRQSRRLNRQLIESMPPGEFIKLSDASLAHGYNPDQVRAMAHSYEDFPVALKQKKGLGPYILTPDEYKKLSEYLEMRSSEVPTVDLARRYGLKLPLLLTLCQKFGVATPHQRPIKGRDPTETGQGRRWYWYEEEYEAAKEAFEDAFTQ